MLHGGVTGYIMVLLDAGRWWCKNYTLVLNWLLQGDVNDCVDLQGGEI